MCCVCDSYFSGKLTLPIISYKYVCYVITGHAGLSHKPGSTLSPVTRVCLSTVEDAQKLFTGCVGRSGKAVREGRSSSETLGGEGDTHFQGHGALCADGPLRHE